MKSLSSWLISMFMGMFLIFRVVVAFEAQYGKDFGGFTVFNYTVEIALLFVAILCIILFLRRNIVGGIIYLASYGYYFGGYIVTNIVPKLASGEALSSGDLQNTFVSAVAVVLAFCAVFDILATKARKSGPKDAKTDWFFKNEKYERKYDERADKNQYRNY